MTATWRYEGDGTFVRFVSEEAVMTARFNPKRALEERPVKDDQTEEAMRFNWGDKTYAEIVHEFAVIRGDLVEQSGRDALTWVLEWKLREALDNASAAVDW